jgi:hypothetical protein
MIYERLYTDATAASLLAHVPDLMRQAEQAKLQCVAPTCEQRAAAHALVLAFAAARGRKMYGAWALKRALERVPASECPDADPGCCSGCPELELYSPDPIADATELADRLFVAGHRYVQAREAGAHRTYVVSVEFVRLCSITYVPLRVFAAIPTMPNLPVTAHAAQASASNLEAAGLLPPIVSPSFMMLDYLRVLCDPFTSYWKLDRALPRLVALQRAFPVGVPARAGAGAGAGDDPRVAAAVAWAAGRGSCASVGEHARAFFGSLVGVGQPRPLQQLALVSVDYASDLLALVGALEANATPPDEVVEHAELIGVLGRRATVRFGNRTLVTLVDAGGRAVPVGARALDGVLVAGFSYCLLATMAMRFLATVNAGGNRRGGGGGSGTTRANGAERFHAALLGDMLAYRAAAEAELAATELAATERDDDDSRTPAEDSVVTSLTSPFRDVGLAYIGWPKSDMRIHMEMTDRRRVEAGTNRATVWFTYDPCKPDARPFKYRLLRCDGEPLPPADSVLLQARTVARLNAQLYNTDSTPNADDLNPPNPDDLNLLNPDNVENPPSSA